MFDIAWSEMAVIATVALLVIGPKDLPRVLRSVGQWVRKGRMMAMEFQRGLEDIARDSQLDDVRREIEKTGRIDFKGEIEKAVDPKGEIEQAFRMEEESGVRRDPVPLDDPAVNSEAGTPPPEPPPEGAKP
ncbi:MAG: twin-arginine translocase subunit TatB [Alphaproteobacteria bacterium]|nr:twin-arginine translocase subunit TatB [Alphaproteobacteria bacterium]